MFPVFNSSSPGENGKPVFIENKSTEVKRLINEGYNKHGFNQYVCEKISLHRSLRDRRDSELVIYYDTKCSCELICENMI